ncbi:superoxide reductase [Maridesulfovibrio ferrireducens]|uniref:Superoxide reductase n=1 Tax=Maridesulfovibrio ferrireducens TaxID=246191 RepID=A0A1G9F129_9BACT|nr:desulfoferrodoxin family protein [Maridesulfovibrio ferrireducens]SDK82062.1 superoxide reductase [Maridesulfovibrio ferrireducens]
MTSRRKFMAMSAAAVAGTLLAGGSASADDELEFPYNVAFTKKHQGHWEGKAGSHVPEIEVTDTEIIITTPHPMSESHYIVRHTLVDSKGNPIGAHTFAPTDKYAVSRYPRPSKGKKFYATSFCNLHDLWVEKFKI